MNSHHEIIERLQSLHMGRQETFLLVVGEPDDEAQDEDIWSLLETEVRWRGRTLEELAALLEEIEAQRPRRGRQLYILNWAQDEDIWSLRQVRLPRRSDSEVSESSLGSEAGKPPATPPGSTTEEVSSQAEVHP